MPGGTWFLFLLDDYKTGYIPLFVDGTVSLLAGQIWNWVPLLLGVGSPQFTMYGVLLVV